jgi:hypothetical protein
MSTAVQLRVVREEEQPGNQFGNDVGDQSGNDVGDDAHAEAADTRAPQTSIERGLAGEALVQRLAAGHRETEDLLVELDKGEGGADQLLRTLRDQLRAELALWHRSILPLIGGLGDRHLAEVSERLHSERKALTRALPLSTGELGFRARITRLCERLEVHHAEEEERVLLPLSARLSPGGRSGD